MKKIYNYLLVTLTFFILSFSQLLHAEVELIDFSKGVVVDYQNGKSILPVIRYSIKNTGQDPLNNNPLKDGWVRELGD